MNKKVLLPILLLAAGIAGFAALKATRPKPPATVVKQPVWRVQVVTAQAANRSPMVSLYGRVESPEQTRAAAPGVGRVLRVAVREGQAIAPGQFLLELDPRDFQPKVDQARGAVAELEAGIKSEELRNQADADQLAQERKLLGFAAAEVERFERLRQENFYSQSAVDQGRQNLTKQEITLRTRELAIADHAARMAQLRARLIQARATLEQAELALKRSRISAPFAGYVAKLEVAVGDQVNTGQSLISLYPLAGLEVRAKLPATLQDEFLAALHRGEHARATAQVAGQPLEFRLTRTAAAADASGLDAFFTARHPVTTLRVGELVDLRVARGLVANAIPLPYSALFDGHRVYRIESGARGRQLQALDVEVVGDDGGKPPALLVTSPQLKQGDLLLATHLPNAVSGLRVEIVK